MQPTNPFLVRFASSIIAVLDRAIVRSAPSDAGLLPVRQLDRHIGLTRSFADALDGPAGTTKALNSPG